MSQPFIVQGGVREDGSWTAEVTVADGSTVNHSEVARFLTLCLEFFTRSPGARCPTVSEVRTMEAARALPDGWEATPDGVNVEVVGGVAAFSRTYARGEQRVVAPCAQHGAPLPETRAALLAAPLPTPEA